MTLFEVTPAVLSAVPLVMALVQVVKNWVPSKYAPLVSLVFGIGTMAVVGGTWQEIVISGLLIGLTASGLYSTKAIVQ